MNGQSPGTRTKIVKLEQEVDIPGLIYGVSNKQQDIPGLIGGVSNYSVYSIIHILFNCLDPCLNSRVV